MKLNTTFLFLVFLASSLLLPEETGAQPPHKKRTPPTAECPVSIAQISDCPDTGCGENGDIELNKAKNRTDTPSEAALQHKTLASMRSLAQPHTWNTGDDRTAIRTPGKEGTPVDLRGFVLKVKPGGGESCNCDITRTVVTYVHLVLGTATDDEEATSVTVEITPRVRANGHPNWLFKNVKDLEGEYVRVTGWLMLDTKHIRQTQFLPNEGINKALVRATNWEVHPVTKLEVCQQSVSACKANQGWEEF